MGRHSAGRPTAVHERYGQDERHSKPRRRPSRLVAPAKIAVAVTLATSLGATASALAGTGASARPSTSSAGPSTVEALTSELPNLVPPASLVASNSGDTRRLAVGRASRASARPEPETDNGPDACDGVVTDPGTNGRVPRSELCALWQRPFEDRADAVVALFALNDEYAAVFGEPICLSSGYRTYEEQAALRRTKGAVAAPAGLSNHGWGLAVDLCSDAYASARGRWLAKNAGAFGWENPAWARKGGSGFYEPWHWEYVPGRDAVDAAQR